MEDKWLEALKDAKCLSEKDLKDLCVKAKEIFIEESNAQYMTAPVTICGDLHGQIYDLLELFKEGGEIPKSRYIFMGDYVDRGYNGVEVVELLLVLKVKYPDHILILRGNHESRAISFSYGFYKEIIRKYGNPNPWHYFIELFDYFPLAGVVEGKIFCIHGGISPFASTINQIRFVNRRKEIPRDGLVCDLLWSDPDDINETWTPNPRGAGWLYGNKAVNKFNHINGLDLICRAHQLIMEGFKYSFEKKNLCTVWSAPNYCYRCGNKASILKINSDLSRSVIYFDVSDKSESSIPPKSVVPYFL